MTSWTEITASTMFEGARILAEHSEGMRGRELWPLIEERFPDLEQRWREAGTGTTSPEKNFQWYSVDLVKNGWLRKTEGRWYLTPLGRAALTRHPDHGSFFEAGRAGYRYWERNKPGFETAKRLVEAVPEGNWAAAGDLAAQAGLETAPGGVAPGRASRGVAPDPRLGRRPAGRRPRRRGTA
ncbi:hypothetical protein [Planomonospora algeriensis]